MPLRLAVVFATVFAALACERGGEADRIVDITYVRTSECGINLTMTYFASPEGTSTRDYGLSAKLILKGETDDDWTDIVQSQLEPEDFVLNETNAWGPFPVTLSGPTRIRGMIIDRNSFGDRITGTCASVSSGVVDYDYRHFDNLDASLDCEPVGFELIDYMIALVISSGACTLLLAYNLWQRCRVRFA